MRQEGQHADRQGSREGAEDEGEQRLWNQDQAAQLRDRGLHQAQGASDEAEAEASRAAAVEGWWCEGCGAQVYTYGKEKNPPVCYATRGLCSWCETMGKFGRGAHDGA
jgi:hypothetical protein